MKFELETVKCPNCDSDDFTVVLENAEELYNQTREKFNVVACKDCGLRYTNPRPTLQTIGLFYPDHTGYFSPSQTDIETATSFSPAFISFLRTKRGYNHLQRQSFKTRLIASVLSPFFSRSANLKHIPDFVPGGKMLDIGSAWGRYLLQARALGWACYGFDMNSKSIEIAKNELGFEHVSVSTIETYTSEQKFDAINMSMVVEHFHDPVDALSRAGNLLKPNGALMISVPNFNGLEFKIFGKNAYSLHVPQHICHFDPKILSSILQRQGFKVEKIVCHHTDRDYIASLKYTGRFKPLLKILTNSIIRRLFVKPIVYILGTLSLTSRMTIYARKK